MKQEGMDFGLAIEKFSRADAECTYSRERLEHFKDLRKEIDARALIDNRAAQEAGAVVVFDYEDVRFSHLRGEFPYLTADRLEEILIARGAEAETAERHDVAVVALEEAQRVLSIEQDAMRTEAAAEHRAGMIHWDRRFHTSLAIGHGAAFAAIVNHVFDKDTAQAAIQAASPALVCFSFGLLISGSIPWVLAAEASSRGSTQETLRVAAQNRSRARWFARVAAALFVVGVAASVGGAFVLGWGPKTVRGSAPAESKSSTAAQALLPTALSGPAAMPPPPSPPTTASAPKSRTSSIPHPSYLPKAAVRP